jgi:hypothetical protein
VSDFGGGCGGEVILDTDGTVNIGALVTVGSGPPDGGGGFIEFTSRGTITVEADGSLNAEGNGGESFAGEILLDVTRGNVEVLGPVMASGGDSGGEIAIDAGGNVTINVRPGASPAPSRSRRESAPRATSSLARMWTPALQIAISLAFAASEVVWTSSAVM